MALGNFVSRFFDNAFLGFPADHRESVTVKPSRHGLSLQWRLTFLTIGFEARQRLSIKTRHKGEHHGLRSPPRPEPTLCHLSALGFACNNAQLAARRERQQRR